MDLPLAATGQEQAQPTPDATPEPEPRDRSWRLHRLAPNANKRMSKDRKSIVRVVPRVCRVVSRNTYYGSRRIARPFRFIFIRRSTECPRTSRDLNSPIHYIDEAQPSTLESG